MIQLANTKINTVYLGSTKIGKMYLGNTLVYSSEDTWYGVSWSENDSNPDVTRIGNMDMHRELPIHSLMKPYAITGDTITPIGEDFVAPADSSVFVKIPEFWYCDDYVADTKTHNLKLSPTPKLGWQHHKEAYVSAYEGASVTENGTTYYKSIKDVLPTASKSRTTFRNEVRNNGSIKWNLYTYTEHRAICHLFMVEYATRNSQKAINTTLTTDGFRQGGLGNGVTIGTATINGATAYSICLTGSSDSLGSGTGQVTVTIQQTDANGANTTTVTRTVNRYRGIENPFGHLWKFVDDVISVYDSTTALRTFYHSIDPTNFATTKNNSYVKLLALPIPSNGYRKEIEPTVNCDFFASTTGASSTTYWCDYNYDNTDTSQHCLLIGGGAGSGATAGLFSFLSNTGVSGSTAYFGCRLTYLP